MSNRIYGTRTDINEQEVRDFYNKRAALASSMKNPLSAVVNGEQNPEQADTRRGVMISSKVVFGYS